MDERITDMEKEIITITEVKGRSVSYRGSKFFSGCDISNFPEKPKVGKKYVLTSEFKKPSVIHPLPAVSKGIPDA
jgi:hypothetical protein